MIANASLRRKNLTLKLELEVKKRLDYALVTCLRLALLATIAVFKFYQRDNSNMREGTVGEVDINIVRLINYSRV